jgi:hypothetical protein
VPEFTRYAPPAGSFIRTSQLRTTREWVEPFMAQIEPYLASARQQSNYMPVGVTVEGPALWRTARGRCSDVSVKAQREFGYQVATQIPPARWGSGHLDLAIRTGIMRDWIVTWRPLIDSLVAILGRRREPSRREFDVEDGRVVQLALHHSVDPMLGNAIEVDVRWRLAGRADGPPLDYGVRGVESTSAAPA